MPSLNVTVGALLLGVLVTAVGYGITTMQTYLYMSRFPEDPRLTRWTVWSLLLLDTVHVMLSWHMVYYYLINNFNNPPALDYSVWSFDVTVVITAAITVIVHCFYARRIYILGGKKWWLLVAFIIILSAMRLIFGCIVTVRIFQIKRLALFPVLINPEVGAGLGAGTLADCIITGTLVYLLRGHKSGFNPRCVVHYTVLLDKITYWTVNNGMLTSIVGVIVIVTFSVMPDNMIFLAVHLLLSKLYANSLLATLNFRQAHRGRGFETDNISIPMSSVRTSTMNFNSGKDSHTSSTASRSAPVVHIVTSTTTDGDYDQNSSTGFGNADFDFKGREMQNTDKSPHAPAAFDVV